MGHMACTEPQYLHKGALYLYFTPNEQTIHGYSLWRQTCRMCGLSMAILITSCVTFIAGGSNRQIANIVVTNWGFHSSAAEDSSWVLLALWRSIMF